MGFYLQPPLSPRNGFKLNVLCIARISTIHQDERSLSDQEAMIREYLEQVYDGQFAMTVISSRGSGEHLDRKELYQAEEMIESGQLDLVIAEDLARICRRKRAYDFCELCVDHGTRLIALNDRVDTGQDGWEDSAFISTWHHERSNRDTSDRIKRTLRNRFSQGGVVQTFIYGYVKPAGTKSDADVMKDPAAEPIYHEWFQRIDNGASYAEIADWLNEQCVPVGPSCKAKRWSGSLVSETMHNKILKGVRVRNKKKSVRVNKTGRHRSVNASPAELLERHCPHLAFFDAAYYDRVIAKVDSRNAKYTHVKNGHDPLRDRPRKRTRWPGQHLYCEICGRMLVYGGHGQTDHLVCDGAKNYKCWNGITADGPTAKRKLIEAIMAEIERIPDFEPTFRELVQQQLDELGSSRQKRLQDIARVAARNACDIDHIVGAIRKLGDSESLLAELSRLEQEKAELERERQELEQAPRHVPELPSIEQIKQMAREKLAGLAEHSPECCRWIHVLIPKIVVYPCRLCDGGHIVLRAKFRLDLSSLLQVDKDLVAPTLQRDMVVDLFDPPQREAIRKQLVEMRAGGMTQREAAQKLGVTHTAAQFAAALQRQMDRLGLTDPYIPVLAPPEDDKKLKRHKHRRYRFEPLDDMPQS